VKTHGQGLLHRRRHVVNGRTQRAFSRLIGGSGKDYWYFVQFYLHRIADTDKARPVEGHGSVNKHREYYNKCCALLKGVEVGAVKVVLIVDPQAKVAVGFVHDGPRTRGHVGRVFVGALEAVLPTGDEAKVREYKIFFTALVATDGVLVKNARWVYRDCAVGKHTYCSHICSDIKNY